MNSIVITWQQLLYISLVLLLFYAATLWVFLRKSSRNRASSRQENDVQAELKDEIHHLRREMETLKVRMAALLVHSTSDSTSTVGPHGAVDDTPYSQAIRMAQQGVDADKVSESCGISRGEADLIVALYRTSGSSR